MRFVTAALWAQGSICCLYLAGLSYRAGVAPVSGDGFVVGVVLGAGLAAGGRAIYTLWCGR